MKYLYCLLLLPAGLMAQENKPVTPVISSDYQRLIHTDGIVPSRHSTYHTLQVKNMAPANTPLRKLAVRRDELVMRQQYPTTLYIKGVYSATMELKTVNRQPALQTQFVQGRSGAWQGPETNELFSYGPALHSLEFDGSAYTWDINGKLVPAGTGNGHNAIAYMNSIFHTGSRFSQSFDLQSRLMQQHNNIMELNLHLGHSNENTVIRDNNNYHKELSATAIARIKWLRIAGTIQYTDDAFSNTNRNGFLNQVYRQSILTPVSFDNAQGYTLGAGQRSYSLLADNPGFLLHNPSHYANATSRRMNLVLERNSYKKVKYTLSQLFDRHTSNSGEGYQPGSSSFPSGKPLYRNATDKLYQLKGEAYRNIPYGVYSLNGDITARYIFTNVSTGIQYLPNEQYYRYARSQHELSLSYNTSYALDRWFFSLGLEDKVYVSNTATRKDFLLPAVKATVRLSEFGDGWSGSINTLYTQVNTELPLSGSLADISLLRYKVSEAGKYLPAEEIAGFDQLAPIHHTDWTGSLVVNKSRWLGFTGTLFLKQVTDDQLPIFEKNNFQLVNVANHQTKGIDLELWLFQIAPQDKRLQTSHTLSFYAYRNKVTSVLSSAEPVPMAGFSDVHTAVVAGQPMGVIMGSTWERDARGNRVIGADGFPLVAKNTAIIGNPHPDFIVKWNNTVHWWKLDLYVNVEWKKGGDRWNGTRAALDYYGRSQGSAQDRNVNGYIFPGVLTNGAPNHTPVSFYDPKLPLETNRWVRYGEAGVAADYIERADQLRLNTLKLSFRQPFRQGIRQLTLSAYVNNLVLWTPYKGVDPEQRLFDQTNSIGLDYFNLPATKTYGINASIQF
ncbi:hypothetical protein [Chitinophaga eiseniae]|uniref:TonB-linked outer membrane protein, SusC/RagA family n=1 Tax=Chitinophaga eiseniae TaxID=634771 RepID=A0A847SDR0_9BACT|nr:hypothetical protein [Chitinophaga eiseniae]NLR77903.1 hypothetical protein [Chitinophaga eiseniae]